MFRNLALASATLLAALVQAAPAASAPVFEPGRVVVRYDASSTVQPTAIEAALGATLVSEIQPLRLRVLQIPRDRTGAVLAELRADPAVRFAERDAVVEAEETVPNDSLWAHQSSLTRAAAPRAWDVSLGSASVVVAVLDTGVDASHPDLQGKLAAGYDFVNGDADPQDDHGHGTAVAGIVGAATNNGRGIAGTCWRCTVMPVKVLDANGTGTDSQVTAGIVWAVERGARIINLSLGSAQSSTTLAAGVQYARERGVLVVAAAGNEGTTEPSYPAAYQDVVSVAATDESDAIYSWSNRGSWVGFAAPGTNAAIWLGGTYTAFSGTSSAAPVVAGIAGLAFSAAPAATVADVRRALAAAAVHVDGVVNGRVDAYGTLSRLAPVPPPSLATAPKPAPAPVTAPGPSVAPVPSAAPAPAEAAPAAVPAPAAPRSPAPAIVADNRRVFDGMLGPQQNERTLRLRIGGGRTTAVVVAPKALRITLTLRGPDGRVLARTTGTGRVGITRAFARGSYRFVVTAASKRAQSFRLSLIQL